MCLLYGGVGQGKAKNATVTVSWFVHSCSTQCWRDDIWHRFHMLEFSLFDACKDTRAEKTVPKCFDAISQQSVKQKTFVAFYTRKWKQCQHKRMQGSVDRSWVSLLMPLHPLCVCHRQSECNIHISWVKDKRGMGVALMGATLPCGLCKWRTWSDKETAWILVRTFLLHRQERFGSDWQIKIKHEGRSHRSSYVRVFVNCRTCSFCWRLCVTKSMIF